MESKSTRYLPKKMMVPVKAIREHCIECHGGRDEPGYIERVAECPSKVCALYEYRSPIHIENL
jgi:hypothetical protein